MRSPSAAVHPRSLPAAAGRQVLSRSCAQVLLSPQACKAAWQAFMTDSARHVQQAMAVQVPSPAQLRWLSAGQVHGDKQLRTLPWLMLPPDKCRTSSHQRC